jgi:hypothetical protein
MATLFNDKLFGQRAFQQLTELLTPLNAFSSDISSEVRGQGDAVIVPLFGTATTTTFSQAANSGNPYEQTGGGFTAITVNLDKRKITPMDLTLQQLAESSNAARFDQWAIQLGSSMAQSVLTDIWSVITTTNFGAAIITTAATNYGRNQLIAARKALISAGVRGEKAFIGNMDIEAALLGDDKITLALNRGDNLAIREGNLGRLLGMDIYSSDVLPLNSVSLAGFACGRDAIAIAMRNLGDYLPNEEYDAVEQFVDAESGISALYTRHWSRAQGKWFMNLHCLYGYTTAVTNALKVFTVP